MKIAQTTTVGLFAAVLLVGVTGYGCGAIFALHGAPDLALTQFLVETLTLVFFVLVLRVLPAEADADNMRRARLPRALLAVAVGASTTGLAAFAMAARHTIPISSLLPDAAYLRGHGANTVNVILVDFRGYDTFGEITVLGIAALAIFALWPDCAPNALEPVKTSAFPTPARRATASRLASGPPAPNTAPRTRRPWCPARRGAAARRTASARGLARPASVPCASTSPPTSSRTIVSAYTASAAAAGPSATSAGPGVGSMRTVEAPSSSATRPSANWKPPAGPCVPTPPWRAAAAFVMERRLLRERAA